MRTASLITLLENTADISSLLSAPSAIYEQVLPRGYKLPAIAVHRYGGALDQDMTGPVNIREDNLQLDIYGDTQADCDAVTDACRALLVGFTGTLADGTVITGAYLEQDRDMPFLPHADTKSLAFRAMLGLRFVSQV